MKFVIDTKFSFQTRPITDQYCLLIMKNKNNNTDDIVRELIDNLLNAVFVPSPSDVSSQKCHIIDPASSGTFCITI